MVVVCEDELQRARRRQAGGADEDEGGVHAAIYQVSDFTSSSPLPPVQSGHVSSIPAY